MPEFLSDCPTPCFLELVFYQELEKTGFRFVRDRESDEIQCFPNWFYSKKHAQNNQLELEVHIHILRPGAETFKNAISHSRFENGYLPPFRPSEQDS